jgi:O-antigen/teichoic acid export membrane protein
LENEVNWIDMAYTVAQNTSFLTTASVVQKLVSFAYFTLVARLIGVGNTGSYFFAITFTTIFTVVADFGFGPVLTREASKYPDQAEKYFNTTLWTKIVFGLVTYVLVVLSAKALGYSEEVRSLINLSGVTMFFDNLQGAFFSVFRSRKNLIFESVAVVFSQVLTLVVGTVALLLKLPLIWLIAAYTIPSAIIVAYAGISLYRAYGIRPRVQLDRPVFKMFVAMAAPFALAGILGRLYSYSDTLIMSKMLTPQDLGWWSVPYKITFAFQFIPVALSASVYPAMSSLVVSQPEKVGELFAKAWKYLFVIVFPLSFGLMAVAHPVIVRLYGEQFLPSIPVLRILLVSLIFSYLSIITGALLNATGRQSIQTVLVGIALVCNVLLNIILIPKYGIVGAAMAALIGNIVLWTLGFYFARRSAVFGSLRLLKNGTHIFVLSLLMAVAVYMLTLKVSFLITIPFGVVLYGALLFFTGVVDMLTVRSLLLKVSFRKTL